MIWAAVFAVMTLMCWVVLPSAITWEGLGEEAGWMLADADEDRSEENKQGEEETSDDEVKKWSERSVVSAHHAPPKSQCQGTSLPWTWEVPYRKGLFEPPEVKG